SKNADCPGSVSAENRVRDIRNFEGMIMAFSDAWHAIHVLVKPRKAIRKWSQDKGELDGSFDATKVESGSVDIETEAGSVTRIGKQYFEAVYDLWEKYRYDSLQRKALGEVTRHSTYIISIFHLLEKQLGKLP